MPIYVYRREDGTTFEIQQRITEDALTVCPTTGQDIKRVISANTGLIFKGSGFYLTDYVRNQGGEASKADSKAESKAGSEAGAASEPQSESKPAEAAGTKED